VTVEFRLPDLGEGIHEAQVLAWKVRPGDHVEAFQPLVEVESAKAAVELTSPAAGTIASIGVAEGETAHLGDLLVVIDDGVGHGAPPSQADGTSEPEYFGIVGTPPRPEAAVPPAPAAQKRVLAAPFVRKLARERGIRLEDVPGSGPQGRIRVADLDSFAAAISPASPSEEKVLPPPGRGVDLAPHPPEASAADEIVPLQGLRKRIADHMVEAMQRAPQVTAMDLLDVTELVHARDQLRPLAEAEGVRLTYLPFLVKASVAALRAVPHANAVMDESSGALVRKAACNIGIATAVPGGLVVPVVKAADRLSLLEIAREIERLVAAARARRSTPDDLNGGTFTITSFGGFPGSPLYATPILNHPEVAILGVGRVDLQPRVVDGAVVPRHCLGVSFTFDHRVLDGEAAARFMVALRVPLEHPLQLLLHLR
jgi:pyruvate dehydrogenase E2 component (dihydrolipoamide acetyltransferase)